MGKPAFARFPHNGGIFLKTQLEQQNSPSPEEKEEKKAKQKRRRKKASAPLRRALRRSLPSLPLLKLPRRAASKEKRTVALSGAGHAFSFFARAGISSSASHPEAEKSAPHPGRLLRQTKKRGSASKQKSAQPQKLPITPAPSARPRQPLLAGELPQAKNQLFGSHHLPCGLHEIGKNMTVIEYGSDIVGVDCGLSLSRRNHAGRGTR